MPKISGLPPITTPASDDELPIVDTDQSTTKKVTVSQLLPPGTIMDYAGASAPGGWLLCFGQTLNAVTDPEYQSLFNAIGNTFGGTDNTDFVVPDLRGRVIAGKDNMGGSSANRLTDQPGGVDGDVLGDTGGNEIHTHDVPSPVGYTSGNARMMAGSAFSSFASAVGGAAANSSIASVSQYSGTNATQNLERWLITSIPNSSIQPTIILNKIIKY